MKYLIVYKEDNTTLSTNQSASDIGTDQTVGRS